MRPLLKAVVLPIVAISVIAVAWMVVSALVLIGMQHHNAGELAAAQRRDQEQLLALERRNDAQWCSVLGTLTENPIPAPADPAQNPSRVQSYKLYMQFVAVKARFGCTG